MRIFNSLIASKNVKGGPLGFSIIHSVAKHQTKIEDPLKTLNNSKKKSHKVEKRGGQCLKAPKSWKRDLLGFAFQCRGLWMRSKSSTENFGKSE